MTTITKPQNTQCPECHKVISIFNPDTLGFRYQCSFCGTFVLDVVTTQWKKHNPDLAETKLFEDLVEGIE